jgi:hypothetical protein
MALGLNKNIFCSVLKCCTTHFERQDNDAEKYYLPK